MLEKIAQQPEKEEDEEEEEEEEEEAPEIQTVDSAVEIIPDLGLFSNATPSITSSSTPASPATSAEQEAIIREKDAEILFLNRTNQGLLAEIAELQDYAHNCNSALIDLNKEHSDLQKLYGKLQLDAEKDSSNLTSKLNELTASRGKFVQNQAKSRKPYHDLCPAQKSVVHRDVREILIPELDSAFKKRKLNVSQVVLVNSEGQSSTVKIDATPKHTFSQLTPAELETVSAISDLKSIHRTSHASYAANRQLIKDLPPLAHLKQHDEALKAKMPPIAVAPGRAGGFTPIRMEVQAQLEYLGRKGDLDLAETVHVKCGIDATKLTHNDNACVYSIETISSATEIGLIGAVKGGDGASDMEQCGTLFFQQLKDLDAKPSIKTNLGDVEIKLRGGGDLANLYAQLGLCKATSRFCCPICVLPKEDFHKAAFDPRLVEACNGRGLGRTRANIMNEAVKSKPGYSVKRLPQCPLPRDPNTLIIEWFVFCVLHADCRIGGKIS